MEGHFKSFVDTATVVRDLHLQVRPRLCLLSCNVRCVLVEVRSSGPIGQHDPSSLVIAAVGEA
eukprot:12420433-Karenia_brevis.AAC.1